MFIVIQCLNYEQFVLLGYCFRPHEFVSLVYFNSYWAGFLQLIQGKPHDEHVMKLVVQLDDKDYLKQEITKGE